MNAIDKELGRAEVFRQERERNASLIGVLFIIVLLGGQGRIYLEYKGSVSSATTAVVFNRVVALTGVPKVSTVELRVEDLIVVDIEVDVACGAE